MLRNAGMDTRTIRTIRKSILEGSRKNGKKGNNTKGWNEMDNVINLLEAWLNHIKNFFRCIPEEEKRQADWKEIQEFIQTHKGTIIPPEELFTLFYQKPIKDAQKAELSCLSNFIIRFSSVINYVFNKVKGVK